MSEDGASVYSASELAQAELPGLDTSLRGAGEEFIRRFLFLFIVRKTIKSIVEAKCKLRILLL